LSVTIGYKDIILNAALPEDVWFTKWMSGFFTECKGGDALQWEAV
jgi:hypothetical protein